MTDHNASQDQTALRPDLMLDFANDTLANWAKSPSLRTATT